MAKANFVSVRAGEPLPVPSTAPTAAFAFARIAAPAFTRQEGGDSFLRHSDTQQSPPLLALLRAVH